MTLSPAFRLFVCLVVAALAAVVAAPAALGHNTLVDSSPADGATLPLGPDEVTLTFNDVVQNFQPVIAVVGPGDTRWEGAPIVVLGRTASVPVNPLGPAGTYTIAYRIVSADGHPVEGTLSFTLSDAGTGTPNPASPGAEAAEDNATWIWLSAALAALVLGGGGALLAARRRSSR